MARRALLIGSQRAGLHGVARSLARLAGALHCHGFRCTVMLDASASRIAAALRALCDVTTRSDAAVVVYVGHGLLFESDTPVADEDGGPPRPRRLQALVPVDIDSSTADDPRIITGLDLALALALLDARCHNATLVLDCCHAVGMASGVATGCPVVRETIEALKRELVAQRALRPRGESTSGPVRVLASATVHQAYEIDEGTPGRPRKIGAFSRALAEVLRACPQDTPWWAVEARVAARLAELSDRQQWIGVEGPRERVVFGETSVNLPADALPCAWRDGRLVLDGGREHGLRPGDRFAVYSGPEAAPTQLIGEAQLGEVRQTESIVDDFPPEIGGALLPGAVARRVAPAKCFAVTLEPSAEDLELLMPALPGWSTDHDQLAAAVELRGDRLDLIELSDARRRIASVQADDRAARDVLRCGLRRIGAWLRIRGAHADFWAPTQEDIALTYVSGSGRESPLQLLGEWSSEVPLRVRALHRGGITLGWLHCAVFRVASDRTILPLTPDSVHGVPLRCGEPYEFVRPGHPDQRGFVFDHRGPHDIVDEWLLVYLATHPIVLRHLETVAEALPPERTARGPEKTPPLRRLLIPYRLRRG